MNNLTMKIVFLSARFRFLVVAVFQVAVVAHAQIPQVITFQGKLATAQTNPLNGSFNLNFRLYDTNSGGVHLWQETHTNAAITRGVFAVPLGVTTPLNLPFDKPYWVSVSVGNDGEMSPRQPLTSSPYAFRSGIANGAAALLTPGQNGDLLFYLNGWQRLPAATNAGMVLMSQAPGLPPVWAPATTNEPSRFYGAVGVSGGAGYDNFQDVPTTSFIMPSGGPYTLVWAMQGTFLKQGGWTGSEGGRARAAVDARISPEVSALGTNFAISGRFTNVANGSIFRMQASGGWDNTQFGNPQLGTLGPSPALIFLWWSRE